MMTEREKMEMRMRCIQAAARTMQGQVTAAADSAILIAFADKLFNYVTGAADPPHFVPVKP